MVLRMPQINVRLADGTDAYIKVERYDADQELQDFLNREGRFTGQWVQVDGVGEGKARYVRYEQIVQVDATVTDSRAE
jgi:hypothetical protein